MSTTHNCKQTFSRKHTLYIYIIIYIDFLYTFMINFHKNPPCRRCSLLFGASVLWAQTLAKSTQQIVENNAKWWQNIFLNGQCCEGCQRKQQTWIGQQQTWIGHRIVLAMILAVKKSWKNILKPSQAEAFFGPFSESQATLKGSRAGCAQMASYGQPQRRNQLGRCQRSVGSHAILQGQGVVEGQIRCFSFGKIVFTRLKLLLFWPFQM